MSSKYLAIGIVVGLFIGLPTGYFISQMFTSPSQLSEITNPKIPLYYVGGSVQDSNYRGTGEPITAHSWVVDVSITGNQTLFNCEIIIRYLATNGTWITMTEKAGIINTNENWQNRFALEYFQPETEHETWGGWNVNEGTNVKVEAYGYLKP